MEQRKVCENCLHWQPTHLDGAPVGACGVSATPVSHQVIPSAMHARADDGGPAKLYTGPAAYCHKWEQAEA